MAKLTRDMILDASLAIVDKGGLSALTMRSLGVRLGVTAMAIYRHFENKDAIVSQLMGRVISEYRPAEHSREPWQDWVRETFGRIRRAFLEHPGIVSLAGAHAGLDRASLKVFELSLRKLLDAGLSGEDAIHLLITLVNYTIGSATIEYRALKTVEHIAQSSNSTDYVGSLMEWYKSEVTEGMPALVEQSEFLAEFPSDKYFYSGIDRILESAISNLER